MIKIPSQISFLFLITCWSLWAGTHAQMIGEYGRRGLQTRQNGNKDTSAFNIVNGRIFTPGLGIILSPQPFTPEGGDFLQIAIDVGGDGKLAVPPQDRSDPITQVFNFTIFLTSISQGKNFTISNFTTNTPPFADIMTQESGSTVKHVNFEWPDCLVGNGKDATGTARGDYNVTIHQNFRLNGSDFYSIFNLPISVTNSISQFPSANQLTSNPAPGPLNGNGGRMSCAMISNPMVNFTQLVNSVNNPPGQPYQQIAIQTQKKSGGQVGDPGKSNGQGIGSKPGNAQGALGDAAISANSQVSATLATATFISLALLLA